MEKKTTFAFNKKIYLLGKRKEDQKNVYLEEPTWDCGWYWGFGYLETYTNNARPDLAKDIYTYSHFDSEILNGKQNGFTTFKDYFIETPLTDDEIWQLCDYMKTFYTLQETAELFGRGYSHYTERAKIDILQNNEIVNNINKIYLPKLFEKIENILTTE